MNRRPARWLAAGLAALAIGAAGSCHVPPAYETSSYYMARNGASDASALGCYNSGRSGRMTMFFGSPTVARGGYGATAWGAPDMHVWDVQQTVMNFIRGYAYCRQNPGFVIQIGVGTSNSGLDGRSSAWIQAHGRAWADAVRSVAAWAATYYPGVAQVYGAWDPEPSWSTFAAADAWMHGYDSAPGRRAMFVNAAADGCSTTTATNQPCNNGWNQHRVWHLSWEHDPALPIPQIYRNDGAQARQWQLIDLWATVNRGDGMFFYGAMAQSGACAQVGGCAGIDNTPHEAHDQLLWWLNTDSRTAQRGLQTMTNVHWNS
jgi:hypothetical protein